MTQIKRIKKVAGNIGSFSHSLDPMLGPVETGMEMVTSHLLSGIYTLVGSGIQ